MRPCFLYRRSVYQVVGDQDPDLLLAEDYDYWLRSYREFEIAWMAAGTMAILAGMSMLG